MAALLALLPAAAGAVVTGPFSGERLPRYAALKAELVYLRKGPGGEYAVDFELTRRHLPVRIVGEHGPWRRVVLHDGETGWIHRVMLTSARYVVARAAAAPIRNAPDPRSGPIASLEAATPMRIRRCGLSWCRLEGHGVVGWAAKDALWGVEATEILE
ncbi:MAG: SH3 domain-containing protein [Pseudomonadota bacterium]